MQCAVSSVVDLLVLLGDLVFLFLGLFALSVALIVYIKSFVSMRLVFF